MKPHDLSKHRPDGKSGDFPSEDFSRQTKQDFVADPVELKSPLKLLNATAKTVSPVLLADAEAGKPVGDPYKSILVDVEPLFRKQEEALGRAIHESRECPNSSLSRVPAAFSAFLRLMTEPDAGEKITTDALFASFEAFKAFRETDTTRESTEAQFDFGRKDWGRSAQAAR